MRAVITEQYGSPKVLQITDIPKPTIGENEILVHVKTVAVTAADSRIRGARFPSGFGLVARLVFGLSKPRNKILGNTYSGNIEQVGKNITEYKLGDEVCGMTGAKMGTYIEYLKVSKFKSIAKKPTSISHRDAVGMLFGGTAALYFVRDKLGVSKGERVLINGASGAVGTNAVQLASYFGAEVTGVTRSSNAKLVIGLGAKQTIDYTKQDVVDIEQKFDVIIDTVGNISPTQAQKLLAKNGRAGLMVAGLGEMIKARGPIKAGTATEKKQDIEFLLSLIEQGKLSVVIDKVYPVKDIVKAHEYVDTGKKVGNVIVEF
ncbi:MAG: NAD(P)-dependent alcohol dehydrogenase [bacterium]|nr:NAD(P)-dependent alcohol dehydrogenase [bacterium]